MITLPSICLCFIQKRGHSSQRYWYCNRPEYCDILVCCCGGFTSFRNIKNLGCSHIYNSLEYINIHRVKDSILKFVVLYRLIEWYSSPKIMSWVWSNRSWRLRLQCPIHNSSTDWNNVQLGGKHTHTAFSFLIGRYRKTTTISIINKRGNWTGMFAITTTCREILRWLPFPPCWM